MREKILNFFDILAGYYEEITGRAANDDGKFIIVLGATLIPIGGIVAILNHSFVGCLIIGILSFFVAATSAVIFKFFTPAIMRMNLSNCADAIIISIIFQLICVMLPGGSRLDNLQASFVCIGFIINALGMFFLGSNPKRPEKRTSFSGQET